MVRGKTALIVRLLCSLALVVALWPAKAGAEPCATPPTATVASSQTVASCDMPCCAKRSDAQAMACEKHAAGMVKCGTEGPAELSGTRSHRGRELASASDPCKCEIKSAPSAPVEAPKAVAPGFDHDAFVVILAATPPQLPAPLHAAEPGIYGVDSGPPDAPEHLSDFGRAPPVARA